MGKPWKEEIVGLEVDKEHHTGRTSSTVENQCRH